MDIKYIYLPIIGLLLSFSIKMTGQNNESNAFKTAEIERFIYSQNDTNYIWKPCTSPYFELLGKGFFSLNVDFRRKEYYAVSFGIAGIEEGLSPNVMGYYFAGKRHRFETGSGASINFLDKTIINIMVHGVIGYRYQKKRGVFFRCGFTPMFVLPFTDDGKYAFIPWAGISLGYSF